MEKRTITIEGNEAAARVAYKLSEVCAIYPITPSSPMGEAADAWAAATQRNLWGHVPEVLELQSEAVLLVPSTARCRVAPWQRLSPRRRACCS